MKDILEYLFSGKNLSQEQAYQVLINFGKGMYSNEEFAAFLTVYKMRPLTATELSGFRKAMIEMSSQVDLSSYNGLEIVGTGGDCKNTFNISTLSAFIVSGVGINIVKHGNYAATSVSGASNVLEYFGYKFTNDEQELKRYLDKGGFCFMHAPLFHPVMGKVAPIRKSLPFPTFFNLLGPIINPSSPRYQMYGTNNRENFDLYKGLNQGEDVHCTVINSIDGYDEISLTDNISFSYNGKEKEITPSDFGFNKVDPKKLSGGKTVKEAANIFYKILEGKGEEEQNHVVIANAAIGIKTVYPEKELLECVAMAKESLESGKALKNLKAVVA